MRGRNSRNLLLPRLVFRHEERQVGLDLRIQMADAADLPEGVAVRTKVELVGLEAVAVGKRWQLALAYLADAPPAALLGTGIMGRIGWQDIEISADRLGALKIVLSGGALLRAVGSRPKARKSALTSRSRPRAA